jgi:hypothetical protein
MSHSNQLLLKRLERKINSLGGGEGGPDSVDTTHITNGTITTADIALGTIDISNLSASCIASLSGGGGGLTANSVNSSHIINGSILTIDICDNAITYEKIAANAVTNTRIANLAVTHAKLSSDCVQSHNILDRTILGIDISLGQISEAHFDASFTTQLTAFAGILGTLSRPFGIIRIINQSVPDNQFDYDLYVYNAITTEYDSLASATRLKKNGSFSHFYQVENNLTNMKLVVSGDGIGVGAFNMLQGAEYVDDEDGELIFKIGDSSNYQNIEIGVEVYV